MTALIRACVMCLLMLAGCGTLQSIFFLPEQTTAPPSRTGLLAELGEAYSSNWQVPLNDGPTALEWRLIAIDSATDSIDLQSFIWKSDQVGDAIQDRIIAAADRGVDVKILIDDSFLAGKDSRILELHQHENIHYRIYNPYKRRSNSALTRTLLNQSEFGRLDHRMHNKVMVVDNHIAIIGGRNLADEYFGFHPEANFRDMELLLGGPIVQKISASFDSYFNDQWSFPVDRISHARMQPVSRNSIASQASDLQLRFPPKGQSELRAAWFKAVRDAHRASARLYVDRPPAKSPEAPSDRPVQVAEEITRIVRDAPDEIIIVSAYLIPTRTISGHMTERVRRLS